MATAVFGLFAGFASLIIVLGGAVLTLRLWWRELPTEPIAGGLPTRLLLSVGLDVALQLLIFGGFAALTLMASRRARQARRLVVFAAASVAAFVLVYPFLRTVDDRALAVVIVAGIGTALVGSVLVATFATRPWWLLAAVVVVFLAWRIPFEFTAAEVLDAKACTLTGTETMGLFVGESDRAVFIGVEGEAPHIVEIPATQIYRLFIGEDLGEARCPPAPTR
jgi:hypothetical protein